MKTNNREKQKKQVLKALMNKDVITWRWGADQYPQVADCTRICRFLIADGVPVQKIRIYTDDSFFMTYFLKEEYINRVNSLIINDRIRTIYDNVKP